MIFFLGGGRGDERQDDLKLKLKGLHRVRRARTHNSIWREIMCVWQLSTRTCPVRHTGGIQAFMGRICLSKHHVYEDLFNVISAFAARRPLVARQLLV